MSLNYTGVITRPDITGLPTNVDSGIYHSLKVASNFEDTKIAVSNDYNGKVTIYNYTSNNNTWNFEHELYSGSTVMSNGFGVSLTMDWDAERIAVGANLISKVYTFDYENGAWSNTPRVINGNPNSGFGYSISMAANDKRLLCIGAPLENKVYVYNDNQTNWTQVFVNDGTDIISRVPLSPNSNIIMKSQYNAYGYHVYMSPSGSRVIAGAPGAVLQRITTNEILYIETDGILSLPATGLDYGYEFDGAASSNGVIPGLMRFVGNARVLMRNGDTWGQQSSGQLGNDIEGDPGIFILESGYDGYASWNPDNTTSGWCMPSFGSCTHIKDDELVITVSSPTHSPGGDRAFFSGKISRFIFDEDTFKWVPYGLDILSRFKAAMYGDSFAIDYTGERIAIGTQTQGLSEISGQVLLTGRVHVLEWSNTSWYELQEIILLEDNGIGNSRVFDKVNVSITNGKNVFCTSVRQGKLYTKDFNLTQIFIGNNLFTGYVASDIYRVGANNGDNSNSTEKKIMFGGTRGDQSYEYTSIENRSLESVEHSELLLFKRSGGGKNTDIIRIKGNEIHLDNYLNGTLITRVLDDPSTKFIFSNDTKTIHRPSLVMNWRGSVCIAPHIRQDLNIIRTWYGSQNSSAPDYNYAGASCDSKAVLDVKGDVYIRNRLNVNDMAKNKIIGTWIAEPHIFYNTRDIDVLYRDPNNSSRILVKSETRPFQFTINDFPGVVEGTVNYLTEYRGFEFIGNGKITNILENGTLNQEVMRTSFWINLQNEQSTYSSSNIFNISNTILSGAKPTSVTCQITSSGIKILYEDLRDGTPSFNFTTNYSFQKDKWYNIQVQLPGGEANTPQAIVDYDPDPIINESVRRSYVGVWVNTIAQSLTLNGTAFKSALVGTSMDLIVGGNTENIIVGMFMHWKGYAFSDNTYPNVVYPKILPIENAYKYGHPSEMLVVGGDATISGKLAIGTVNSTYALDVVGDINLTGDIYQNGTIFSTGGGSSLDANVFLGTWSENSSNVVLHHSVLNGINNYAVKQNSTGVTEINSGSTGLIFKYQDSEKMRIDYTSNVGIGTSSPNTTLHIVADDPIIKVGKSNEEGGWLQFGNSNHGVGKGTGKTNFTNVNDVVLHTGGDGGGAGLSTNFGTNSFKMLSNGFVTHMGGDSTKIRFGPSATFSEYLVIGSGTTVPEAQVLSTNGNLHLDPKVEFSIYMCFYNGGSIVIPSTNTIVYTSDDRLKTDEKFIENATETLNKLKPQTYMKSRNFEHMDSQIFEAGLIAQEVYYMCPELRHLVILGKDANPDENIVIPDDPQIDPDYSSWGTQEASVAYTGFIPYLIKANQELNEKILQLTERIQVLENK